MPPLRLLFRLEQFDLSFRARIFIFTDGIKFDAAVDGAELLVSFP